MLDAVTLTRRALAVALGSSWHWLLAPQGTALPFGVYQSQDGGGRPLIYVGDLAWSGLIVLRACATSQAGAETLLASGAAALASLAAPAGYALRCRPERPIVIPPAGGIWYAAYLYRVDLTRSIP
jgi:hypothetical protein